MYSAYKNTGEFLDTISYEIVWSEEDKGGGKRGGFPLGS